MFGKTRPPLRKGDLVKCKNFRGRPMLVIGYTYDPIESRKLGYRGRRIPTTDGACFIYVLTKCGTPMRFRRRQLWKIPDKDQPRYRSLNATQKLKKASDVASGKFKERYCAGGFQ